MANSTQRDSTACKHLEPRPNVRIEPNRTHSDLDGSDEKKWERARRKASRNTSHSLEPNQIEPNLSGSNPTAEVLETQLTSLNGFKAANQTVVTKRIYSHNSRAQAAVLLILLTVCNLLLLFYSQEASLPRGNLALSCCERF